MTDATTRTVPDRCEPFIGLLAEAAYDALDGDDRRRLDDHLATCPACTAELAELRSTVELLRRAERVDGDLPQEPDLDSLWQRLEPRLDDLDRAPRQLATAVPKATSSRPVRSAALRPTRTRSRSGWPAPALALAAGLAGLAIGIGSWSLRQPDAGDPIATGSVAPDGVATDGVTPDRVAAERTLEDELGRYLIRATPLLLSISNRDPATAAAAFDAVAERDAARRLAAEAASLRNRLVDADRPRQADLVDDLERIFLQVANFQPDQHRLGVELIRDTLERRAILFQLSAEEIRQSARSSGAA